MNKKLSQIIASASPIKVIGNADINISGIASDSRKIAKGWLFVAVHGVNIDGHKFIPDVYL